MLLFHGSGSHMGERNELHFVAWVICLVDRTLQSCLPWTAMWGERSPWLWVNCSPSTSSPGLPLSEVRKLSSYFHFREAIDLKSKTLLEKSDLEPSLDFLDSLEYDIPRGKKQALSFRVWGWPSDQISRSTIHLPSLWPGLRTWAGMALAAYQ